MLNDFEMVFGFGDCRFYIATAFIAFTVQYTPFNQYFCAFSLYLFQGIQIIFYGIFINQWAYMVVFIQCISNSYLFVGVNNGIFNLIVLIFVNDQSSC